MLEPKTVDEVADLTEPELDLLIQRVEVQNATCYPPFFGFSAEEDVEILLAVTKHLRDRLAKTEADLAESRRILEQYNGEFIGA